MPPERSPSVSESLFETDRDRTFEPTREAALERLGAFRPRDYPRTRNHLEGTVSGLSPYITHGLVTLPEVYRSIDERHGIGAQHKFTYELGWREFFHHQWAHHGDAIFSSMRPGVLPDSAYAMELPQDLRAGSTGVPVVDRAVAELYRTGWLHNHARMWLASYTVHVRKVYWRVAADWMYGHLLDGDLASNHLSWQWVAGTASHKPYLFNAENVARYAPRSWHSFGTVVDCSYETLDRLARSLDPQAGPVCREAGRPGASGRQLPVLCREPPLLAEPPVRLPEAELDDTGGYWMIHPWAIRPAPAGRRAIGVLCAPFHARWPWSELRWRFVIQALESVCERIVWCERPDRPDLWSAVGGSVSDPHLAPWMPARAAWASQPRLFHWPDRPCRSFSDFWHRARLASV
jgi:deoxyribodipyrimidine photo-lyase